MDYKPEDLIHDTKQFLASQYGKHIMQILQEKQDGLLANVASVTTEHPERYAAKYSALKEVIDLINSPLVDDTPTHG